MTALASTVEGAIISSPSSTTLLIAVHRVPWKICSNSTVVHSKMGHMSKTTPLSGKVCRLSAVTSSDPNPRWSTAAISKNRYDRGGMNNINIYEVHIDL